MKKVLSFVTMFVLVMSLTTVNAQDKPKAESKKAKTEDCGTKKGCCDHGSAKKTKKMASKHECTDKCGDGCTMAHKTSSKQEETKKN